MYIDNVKFAKNKQTLEGVINLNTLTRVQEIDKYEGEINYTLQGLIDNTNRPTLQIKIYGIITTLCQNCLNPVEFTLDNTSNVSIFYSEEELDNALFKEDVTDIEDGILCEAEFDVLNFLEDEIIILLPYAPKHEDCVGLSYHDTTENPFNVLKNII